jgi:hypothetical protein
MLDIPGVWDLLAIRYRKQYDPWFGNLEHDEGSFPSRIKLVQLNFILDAVKDQISNIERSCLNILVVVTTDAL